MVYARIQLVARYFIIHPNGDRFGPADSDTLYRWLDEGRLHPDWLAADEETGVQTPISALLPPIIYEEPAPSRLDASPNPKTTISPQSVGTEATQTQLPPQVEPIVSQPNPPNPNFTQYPRGGPDPGAVDSQKWYNASVITGGIAIAIGCCIWLSIPLGAAAIVCGLIGRKSNNKSGLAGIIMGSVAVIISLILFIVFREAMYSFAQQFTNAPPSGK